MTLNIPHHTFPLKGCFPTMKKFASWLLCALLCASLCPTLTACKSYGKPSARNESHTISMAETEAAPQGSTIVDPADRTYDPALYVVIRTAEDLMAFNRAVNEDGYPFDGMTVVFLNDVDMGDHVWSPLDGQMLAGVTFDGLGHTVSNLRFADYEYPLDAEPDHDGKGCGLVGVATRDMVFRDLTLAHTSVTAYDHSVGNFVGSVYGGTVTFENCRSVDFTAEGWMDWLDRDRDRGGHAVAMRMGGFVGYVGEGGRVKFTGCSAEELSLSGFHNLAGFVGYDGSGELDASAFADCRVAGADITFSYCLAENYTAEQAKKFVSVFFNGADHTDNLDDCAVLGNRFEDVTFYDWADDCTAYTPEHFRSWTREEAEPHD